MIRKSDLQKARRTVMQESKRQFPKNRALDTTGPSIESGLVVVGFDVDAAINYCRDLAGRNQYRILAACANDGELKNRLFGAAIASGMIIGAQAERMKNGT